MVLFSFSLKRVSVILFAMLEIEPRPLLHHRAIPWAPLFLLEEMGCPCIAQVSLKLLGLCSPALASWKLGLQVYISG